MGITSIQELKDSVIAYGYNPSAIQRNVLELLKSVKNGEIDIVDPTTPFVFCLESAAVLTAAAIEKNADLTHRQYAVTALSEDELYLHMSDKDFVGRFATPASTKFTILLEKEELINKMLPVPELGTRKLTIPRNSYFTISDVVFSLQYPVEISQMAHGGFQVVYNASVLSPLQTLSTNNIDTEIRKNTDGSEWLCFDVDVQQFNIITKTTSANAATGLQIDVEIQDEFYYCRVYQELPNGQWKELVTTYTPDVFDIKTPTAVVRLSNKNVNVSIPQIYTTSGVINSSVRVDVYQTKGPINMIMGNYDLSSFIATWYNVDKSESTTYSSALNTFRSIVVYSLENVTGGSKGVGLETLRNRVLTNSVSINQLPITPDQLKTLDEVKGYSIVKNIDLVTNRAFLATRELPIPSNKITRSAISGAIATLTMSMEDAITKSGVIDNGSRVTITPDALFKNKEGIVLHVPQVEIDYLTELPNDQKATVITNNSYFYTPFHYVLDASSTEFELRPYYLENPKAITKLFVAENDTTLIQTGTGVYKVSKNEDGYLLTIMTDSGDAFKGISDDDLIVQLAYYPPGESDRAYINGTLLATDETSKERIYQFQINTSYDIDNRNYLYLTNFLMYVDEPKKLPVELQTDFDILFTTTAVVGSQYRKSAIDDALGSFILPAGSIGIKHEKIRIRFGHSLKTLWSRARTVVSPQSYRRAEVDIPAYYKEDIYEKDPLTGSIFTITDNGLIYNLIHKKGDPILDENNKPVYEYRVGDILLEDGKPIPLSNRKISRVCDIFFLDGSYYFANDPAVIDYRSEVTEILTSWLINELSSISDIVLEQTRIYFYPKTGIGNIEVLANDGIKHIVSAEQSLQVTLYVPDRVTNNEEIKSKLEETTVDVIVEALKKSVVSKDSIISALRENYGADVIAISIDGLGGSDNFDLVSIINDTNRFTLKKRLISLADNTITLKDDVNVSFVRHCV